MRRDPDCTLCKRHSTAQTVCILGEGEVPSDVMIIGEAPTQRDDATGVLSMSRKLAELLIENEFEPDEVFYTNAVACAGPKSPTKAQIRSCKVWLDYQMKRVKPRFVLLMGNPALQAITGNVGISKARGRPFTKDGIIYVPTLSIGSGYHDPENYTIISQDINLLRAIVTTGKIPREENLAYTIVKDRETVRALIAALRGTVSVDIETTCLYPWQRAKGKLPEASIVSIGFGTESGEFIIPVDHPETTWSASDMADLLDEIDEVIGRCRLVAHNGLFDFLWLWVHYDLLWYEYYEFDTMLAHYLLDENSRHGLKELARKYLNAPDYNVDLNTKTGAGSLKMHALYLAHDVYYTRKLEERFSKLLKKEPKLYRLFYELMMPCARMFVEIRYDGVYVDITKFDEADEYLTRELEKSLTALKKWEPKKQYDKRGRVVQFNWGSSKQLSKLLYEDLGLEVIEETAAGNPSCSESVLKRLDHELVRDLLAYRGARQQHSFFIEGWEPFLHKVKINGEYHYYLHPSFKLHGTSTGRLSSESPNCIDGEAEVMVPGGTKKMKHIKVGDSVYCYDKRNNLRISKVTNKWCHGMKDTVDLKWSRGRTGKQGHLYLTPDHKVRTIDGRYVRADKLKKGDSLSAMSRHPFTDCNGKKRSRIKFTDAGQYVDRGEKGVLEYRVVFYLTHGYMPEIVHHEDQNPLNDSPVNLKPETRSNHTALHRRIDPEVRRSKAIQVHKDNPHIVEAAIRQRKEWSKSYLPVDLAVSTWEKYRGSSRAAEKAAKELGVTRKTLTNRLTRAGFAPGCKERQNHRVISVTSSVRRKVYDIEVEKHHNFIVNEISVSNCQQIPRDARIRSLITAEPGWTLVECDLSQIELRLAADAAKERRMIAAFVNGEDLHWKTCLREIERGGGQADLVLDTARTWTQDKTLDYSECIEALAKMGPDEAKNIRPEWGELRKKAKAVGFGYLYGMWWRKFRIYARDNYGVKVTDKQAQDSRKFFFSEYADLEDWHNRQKRFAQKNGYVEALDGRKRRLPKAMQTMDSPERGAALRQSVNSPIQGFASDINLMAALQLRREYGRDKVKICATVHDAILVRVRNDYVKEVTERLLEIMRRPELFDKFEITLRVPIEAEAKIGPWGAGVSLEKWKCTAVRSA